MRGNHDQQQAIQEQQQHEHALHSPHRRLKNENSKRVSATAVLAQARQFAWQRSWIEAFPTLLPQLVFVPKHDVSWQQWAWKMVIQDALDQSNSSSIRGDLLAALEKRPGKTSVSGNMTGGCEEGTARQEWEPSAVPTNNLIASPLMWKNSLGYGEITAPAVFEVFQFLRSKPIRLSSHLHRDNSHLHLANNNVTIEDEDDDDDDGLVVVDLGSGNGRVLFASCLCHYPIRKAIGLEIVPSLHQEALINYEAWKGLEPGPGSHSSTSAAFEFRQADFTVDTQWADQAHLVWIHATVFEDALIDKLEGLVQTKCRRGTIFCLVSRPFRMQQKQQQKQQQQQQQQNGIVQDVADEDDDDDDKDVLVTIGELQLDMNWGQGTVYIQQKQRKV